MRATSTLTFDPGHVLTPDERNDLKMSLGNMVRFLMFPRDMDDYDAFVLPVTIDQRQDTD